MSEETAGKTADQSVDLQHMPELVIVTGMSGAGRTEAMHSFEDLGYFCVDNLPSSLIGNLLELTGMPGQPDEKRRLAVVCDARNRDFFASLAGELKKLKGLGIDYRILFLDAADEKLVARYKSSRRRHPLCADGASIAQGIERERDLLFEVRENAHHVIDTTSMLPPQLRSTIRALFAPGEERAGLSVTVYSFGFKHGAPLDADLVMDVRFLPNPYYEPQLRSLTGLDKPVSDFVLYRPETEEFQEKWRALLDCVMPGYVAEGKQQLAIAVGCTGGQHRSVALAESTADYLKAKGYRVSIAHRDLSLAEGADASARAPALLQAGRGATMVARPFSHDPSATAAFAALRESQPVVARDERLRVVVIGGSSGAPVSLRFCPWDWIRAPSSPWPTTAAPPASCARKPTSRRRATCASASPQWLRTRTTL